MTMASNSAGREYQHIQLHGSGRVHLGDQFIHTHLLPSQVSQDLDDSDTDFPESLPRGWESAESPDKDVYYAKAEELHPHIGRTTKIKPVANLADADTDVEQRLERKFQGALHPEAITTSRDDSSNGSKGRERWFYDEIEMRARNAALEWPEKLALENKAMSSSRCSIFTEGVPVNLPDDGNPTRVVQMLLEGLGKGTDSICIIENLNDDWIQALGEVDELNLPYEFFVRHASPKAGTVETLRPLSKNAYVPHLDDIVERALSLGIGLERKKKVESMKKVVDTLCKAYMGMKTAVESWVLSGANQGDIRCVASCVAECDAILSELQKRAALKPADGASDQGPQLPVPVRGLRHQMMELESLRLRRYFNLYATCRYDDHVPINQPVKDPKPTFLNRNGGQVMTKGRDGPVRPKPHRYSYDTQVSYIRADKSLFLILVDSPPHADSLKPRRSGRSKVRVRFPYSWAGRGIDVPELLEMQDSSLYDALKLFACEQWHTEIVCGETTLPPTFQDFLKQKEQLNVPSPTGSKLHTAPGPQAFLLMLSSFVWEKNLRYLERRMDHLNFERLRDARTMQDMSEVNAILHDSREDLDTIVSQVKHVSTHMPLYLASYYDNFPRIRHRHQARHLSPVAHLPKILERAEKLDRLMLDDFQILMSSVSVREGHESTSQTKLATGIALLAFVYVPLTLVTGIFGMNIKDQDGFIWWAPLVALATVVLLTVGLLATALFILAALRRWGVSYKTSGSSSKSAILFTAFSSCFRKKRKVFDEENMLAKNE